MKVTDSLIKRHAKNRVKHHQVVHLQLLKVNIKIRTCKSKRNQLRCNFFLAPHDLTLCYQRVETGNCNESIPSYYFDPVEKKCSSFIYTGCDGNANRYNTEEQCERQCGKFREQGLFNS